MRLSPKGLFRWYTSCCSTPVGNTLKPDVPFVGIVASAFGGRADEVFGPPRATMLTKFAVGDRPASRGQLGMIAHAARLVLGWRLGGKAWPHPFFDRTSGEPTHPLKVLSETEREALRPLCGPK